MTQSMELIDAQRYANQLRRQVYILRRGAQHKATASFPQLGWKLVATVAPEPMSDQARKEFRSLEINQAFTANFLRGPVQFIKCGVYSAYENTPSGRAYCTFAPNESVSVA